MVETAREQWGSRRGFVMAAVGAAVGLGNMWRFSYLVTENGGAAFVLLYIAIMLAVGSLRDTLIASDVPSPPPNIRFCMIRG